MNRDNPSTSPSSPEAPTQIGQNPGRRGHLGADWGGQFSGIHNLYDGGSLRAEPARYSAEAVQLYLAPSPEEEADFIASRLIELHETGRRWSDMAILTRAGSPPIAFETELRKRSIPYVTGRGQGFFDRQEIKDVLAYLRVINNPLDDVALIRLLQGPVVRVSDAQMYAIRQRAQRERKQTTWDLLMDAEKEGFPELEGGGALRAGPEGSHDTGFLEYGAGGTQERVKAALELVREGMTKKARMQLGELLQMILERSWYVALAAGSHAEGQRRMANIRKLTRMAADFEARQVFSGLGDFIHHVELYDQMDIRTPEADVAGVDAVNLMTIHTAKGLEFPVVFLAHLRPYRPRESGLLFFDDNYGLVLRYLDESGDNKATIKYNDWAKYAETPKTRSEKEERRVFYVALTRAKDQLYVTATRRDQAGWDAVIAASEKGVDCNFDFFRQLALFINDDLKRGTLIQPGTSVHTLSAMAEPPLGTPPAEPRLPVSMREGLVATTAPKRLLLSPSALATFAQCPLRYRYLYEWRLPGIPDGMWPVDGEVEEVESERGIPADVMGTLVHELLQWAHGLPGFPSDTDIRKQWETLAEGSISRGDAGKAWNERVTAMIAGYRQLGVVKYATLAIEKRFRLALDIDGVDVVIDGRIDRVCQSPTGKVSLLDYKTTRNIDAPVREAYRRQLAVYQLASADVFTWQAQALLVDLPRGELIESGVSDPRQEVTSYVREIIANEREASANPALLRVWISIELPAVTNWTVG